ncbi:hypothetical protein [Pelagibacterium lentulum]|nr:hypothetical protein [Pelagibacterium lentulum]
MTLSASQPTTKKPSMRARLAQVDDGAILRLAFFAMLAGTISILALDYLELNRADAFVDPSNIANPVLPAVERPDIDPDNPAYRPTERVTTPETVLSSPLELALGPGGTLYLTGMIVPGSAEKLATELEMRGDYIETIALNSPGGSVEDALSMGRMIRQAGFATKVETGSLCASSCPLLLASGTIRTTDPGASVGVHQIYAAPADTASLAPAQAMSDAQSTTARIVRHLTDMDIDTRLWVHALETPPNRLYYLTTEEMADYRLTSP